MPRSPSRSRASLLVASRSFTLRSSTGGVITRKDLLPVWLPSTRVLRGPDGLEERRIYYSVDSVYVEGSSVVNRSQVKFYPADRAVVRVPLLAYTVRVEVVDRLFRWPVGTSVRLSRPDIADVGQPLENGVATFTEVTAVVTASSRLLRGCVSTAASSSPGTSWSSCRSSRGSTSSFCSACPCSSPWGSSSPHVP